MTTCNATHQIRTLCSICFLYELYLPVGPTPSESLQLDVVIHQSHRLRRSEYLFRADESFTFLFVTHASFFRTTVTGQDGQDQITGFFVSDELIRMDGICSHIHSCDVVTLKDSEVCELPFTYIEELGQGIPSLRSHFFRLMSREAVRDQGVTLLLGNMYAEKRLTAFLLNLFQRLYSQGSAANDSIPQMSHEEIGSHSGPKLGAVSRTLSKFHHGGLVSVGHKHTKILDATTSKKTVSGCSHVI